MFNKPPAAIGEGGFTELIPASLLSLSSACGAWIDRQLARCMPKRCLACLSCAACSVGCMRLGERCAKRLGAEPELTGSRQSQPDLNTSFIALAQLDRNGSGSAAAAAAKGHQQVLLAAAGWQSEGVTVTRAPEPNDVYWENLELSESDRRQRKAITTLVIVFLILLGTFFLYFVRTFQIAVNQHASTFDSAGQRFLAALSISGGAAIVTIIWNLLLKSVIEALTHRECHVTRSKVELEVFTKLIAAYFLNSVAIPIFVSSFTLYDPYEQVVAAQAVGVTQAWYESGGVVSQAAILMLSSSIVTDFLRFVHFPALFKRYVLGCFAASQIRLNQLWAPPRMPLGGIYAETFRSLAVGMVYAPIYPPAFLFTAWALFGNYLSTRWAISTWYMRPPLVDGQLMKRMRNACGWLLLGCIMVAASILVEARASGGLVGQALPALLIGFLVWVVILGLGPLLSRSRYYSTKFKHQTPLSASVTVSLGAAGLTRNRSSDCLALEMTCSQANSRQSDRRGSGGISVTI